MPKFRVLHIHRVGDDFEIASGVGRIIEADSEHWAVRTVSDDIGVPAHWLKAERLILTDADRQWYLASTTRQTAPIRRI